MSSLMASVSNQASYIEFKIERAADVDVGSSTSDDDDIVTTIPNKKSKHRWSCGLRRLSTSPSQPQTPRKMELKVSFTIQGVHSFCLRAQTHNIPHGDEMQRSVTLQNPGQQSEATWREMIASCLSGVVPAELMETMASKLQRDLSTLPIPTTAGKGVRRSRLLVLHVHVSVKVVTRDGVTEETLLDRVSTPVLKGEDEDCVICLDGLDGGERGLRKMVACSHVFHGECLLKWLLKRASCPVCWSTCLNLFLPTNY